MLCLFMSVLKASMVKRCASDWTHVCGVVYDKNNEVTPSRPPVKIIQKVPPSVLKYSRMRRFPCALLIRAIKFERLLPSLSVWQHFQLCRANYFTDLFLFSQNPFYPFHLDEFSMQKMWIASHAVTTFAFIEISTKPRTVKFAHLSRVQLYSYYYYIYGYY